MELKFYILFRFQDWREISDCKAEFTCRLKDGFSKWPLA